MYPRGTSRRRNVIKPMPYTSFIATAYDLFLSDTFSLLDDMGLNMAKFGAKVQSVS